MYSPPTLGVIIALVGATIIATRGTIFRGLQQGRAKTFFACTMGAGPWPT